MAPSDVTKFLSPALGNTLPAPTSSSRRQPSAPSPPPPSAALPLFSKLSLSRNRKRTHQESIAGTFESSFDAEVKRARLSSYLLTTSGPPSSLDDSANPISTSFYSEMNGHKSMESRFGSSIGTVSSASSKTPKSPPVASLCNLGNTCFLNSVLYTLRFTPGFLHSLHHMVHDLGLNGNGSKSNKRTNGVAAQQGQTNGSANSISDAETELVHDVIDQVRLEFDFFFQL